MLTDDLSRERVLVRRGVKHVTRIMEFWKASISVMFAFLLMVFHYHCSLYIKPNMYIHFVLSRSTIAGTEQCVAGCHIYILHVCPRVRCEARWSARFIVRYGARVPLLLANSFFSQGRCPYLTDFEDFFCSIKIVFVFVYFYCISILPGVVKIGGCQICVS